MTQRIERLKEELWVRAKQQEPWTELNKTSGTKDNQETEQALKTTYKEMEVKIREQNLKWYMQEGIKQIRDRGRYK